MCAARYSNLFLLFSALALCFGCGIRSGLPVSDAGIDAAAEEGDASGEGAAGSEAPPDELLCGNGVIDSPKEQCDGDDLGGATCFSLGEGEEGVLRCGPACLFDVSMCAPRWPTPVPGGYGTGPVAPVVPFDGGTGDAGNARNNIINRFLDAGTTDGGAAGGGLFGGGTQGGRNQGGGTSGP
jgi:hypothetical protein